jgi:signal transduction histidine kinase
MTWRDEDGAVGGGLILIEDETERGDRETRRTPQWLEGILREGDRVANIVRDLLTFVRVAKEAHSPAHASDIS